MKLFTIGHKSPCEKMDPSLFMFVWHQENNYKYFTLGFMSPFYAKEKRMSLYLFEDVRYRRAWAVQFRVNTMKAFFEEEKG